MHAAGGAGWTRLAGVAGLVFVAATLFALGAAGSTPTAGDPAEVIRAFYKDHFAIEAVSAFALPVCAMLFAFFAGTLGSLVGDDRRSQWRMVFIAGTAAVAIGWIVLGFARMLLVDAVDQALGDAVLQVLVLLDADNWIVTNPALGIFMLGTAGLTLTGSVPVAYRRLGWAALVLGIALFVP